MNKKGNGGIMRMQVVVGLWECRWFVGFWECSVCCDYGNAEVGGIMRMQGVCYKIMRMLRVV